MSQSETGYSTATVCYLIHSYFLSDTVIIMLYSFRPNIRLVITMLYSFRPNIRLVITMLYSFRPNIRLVITMLYSFRPKIRHSYNNVILL